MVRLLAAFVLVLGFSSVGAQPKWKFVLAADQEMSTCAVSGPGIIQIHIFQTGDTPSLAVEFAFYPPDCVPGATWLRDVFVPFLFVYHTQDDRGVMVLYQKCLPMPIHIGFVEFYVPDVGVECCEFPITEPVDPRFPVEAVSCGEIIDEFPVELGRAILNPTPECPCVDVVPATETTWGKMKSLYR